MNPIIYLTTPIGPPYYSCPMCGCVVDNRSRHDVWHHGTPEERVELTLVPDAQV